LRRKRRSWKLERPPFPKRTWAELLGSAVQQLEQVEKEE
jgi:hypothetical protein